MRGAALLTGAVMAGLLLAACGQSDEDKAKSQVCDARADLKQHVDDLSGLTLTTVSVDKVQQGLKAIGSDLTKISDAQANLNPARKKQVEAANKAFRSEVAKITQEVVGGVAGGDVKPRLESAVSDLAASYKQTFAPINCD